MRPAGSRRRLLRRARRRPQGRQDGVPHQQRVALDGRERARRGASAGIASRRRSSRLRAACCCLLDACHSGHAAVDNVALNEGLAASPRREGPRRRACVRGVARRAAQLRGVGGRAAASRGLELAWDGAPPKLLAAPPRRPWPLHRAVLGALSGAGAGSRSQRRDRGGELIDYVTERVRSESNGKQTPWVVRRELFGDFVVAPARR